MTWRLDAACIGLPTEMFYRESDYPMALRTCKKCRVRTSCLGAALEEESESGLSGRHGIRGGTTPAERERLSLSGGARPLTPQEKSALRRLELRGEWIREAEKLIAAGARGESLLRALECTVIAAEQRLRRAGRSDLATAGGLHPLITAAKRRRLPREAS